MPIETILFWSALLILLSVIAGKVSDKFAVPALVSFLAVGILAGVEGPGGISFNDPQSTRTVGIVALIFIIFAGGINTPWKETRPVFAHGVILSTAGVLLTALIAGCFAVVVLKFSFLEGLLLGSIISSTDAAAVFSILKSKRIGLKPPLKPLLEFESGSNDPMAVFLTISLVHLLTHPAMRAAGLIPLFIMDMGMGALAGYLMARAGLMLINSLKLEFPDLYPVLTIALVLLTYSVAVFLKGNGFLAVYIMGIFLNNHEVMHKRTIVRFHETLAWMMQIVMFLTLGLLVFPSHVVKVAGSGLIIAVALMFAARPLSVFICLAPFKLAVPQKAMVAWVGLRGAVPVILATFPLLAGIEKAGDIFNIVFFVVLASILFQGTSIPFVSRLLRVAMPWDARRQRALEINEAEGIDADLTDIIVPYESEIAGKSIFEIGVPDRCLIVVITRNDKFIIPNGATLIEGGDVLQILASKHDLPAFQKMIERLKT